MFSLSFASACGDQPAVTCEPCLDLASELIRLCCFPDVMKLEKALLYLKQWKPLSEARASWDCLAGDTVVEKFWNDQQMLTLKGLRAAFVVFEVKAVDPTAKVNT